MASSVATGALGTASITFSNRALTKSSTMVWQGGWSRLSVVCSPAARRVVSTTTTATLPPSSSQPLTTMPPLAPPLADESFLVTKVEVATGDYETVCLTPSQLLQQTNSILPRDLVSLALTSRERRRSLAAGRRRRERKDGGSDSVIDAESTSRVRHVPSFSSSLSSSSSSTATATTLAVDLANWRHPPAILPRNDCILLSFGHIRAVAERDQVFLFDAGPGANHSKMAHSFARHLARLYRGRAKARRRPSTSLFIREDNFSAAFRHLQEEPPELVFLEAALSDVVDSFSRRVMILGPIVDDVVLGPEDRLDDVNDGVVVHQLAPLREQLQSLEVFVTQAYECLTKLLNDDEEMLKCLLTEQEEARRTNVPVDFERHQQVEILLGIYARQFSSILQEVNFLLGRLQAKQEYIALELALYRNRLIRMNVTLGIIAAATGITTAVSGTFGMNLISGLEDSSYAFALVSGGSALIALFMARTLQNLVSGKVIQQRALARMEEIQTLSSALSDMTALDYTVKKMMIGKPMNREEFKKQLADARHSQFVSDEETDLLFNVLNSNKDGFLDYEDFEEMDDDDDRSR